LRDGEPIMSKSKKSTKRPAVKKSLIRAMPGVPVKEVVAALAKRGVKVTESYVYNVRGAAKKKRVIKLQTSSMYGVVGKGAGSAGLAAMQSKAAHTSAHTSQVGTRSGFPVRPEGELTAGEKLVAGFKAMALELGLAQAMLIILGMREANMAVLRESGAL
jgi:hypothetical protein